VEANDWRDRTDYVAGQGLNMRWWKRKEGERDLEREVGSHLEIRPGTRALAFTRVVALVRQFCRNLMERVERLPGVEAAGLAETGPFSGRVGGGRVWPAEMDLNEGAGVKAVFDRVSPRFFASAGIPMLLGRDFTFADREGARKAAIVDEEAASELFGSVYPIGRRIELGDSREHTEYEIVGVVKSTKHESLKEDTLPAVYFSMLQGDRPWMPTLYVRTAGTQTSLTAAVLHEFQTLDKDLPVFNS